MPARSVIGTHSAAVQVATEIESATAKNEISVVTVYGGAPARAQIREIQNGCDVVVGTPGRTIDLLQKQRCAVHPSALSNLPPCL